MRDALPGFAKALIEPQTERAYREFQDALHRIKFNREKPDWEKDKEAEKLVGAYITGIIRVVAEAIVKVVETRKATLSAHELEALLDALKPDYNTLSATMYQNAQGFVSTGTGYGLAISDSYRLAMAQAQADLGLLAADTSDMARPRNSGGDVKPTLTAHRAAELIQQQITRSSEIERLPYDDPNVDAWGNTTEAILTSAFGAAGDELHRNTRAFKYATFGTHHVDMSDNEMQYDHMGRVRQQRALLAGFVEQLRILAPPSAATTGGSYGFHSEVERIAGSLFRDGHYKQAALESYIRVIDAVRAKSGLALDGDNLMNRAFGSERRTPVLQVNDLSSDAERDEQKGFMYLFKGIVGLRNLKAHSNALFNDPARAHEYLALSSLLLRIVELSKINPP